MNFLRKVNIKNCLGKMGNFQIVSNLKPIINYQKFNYHPVRELMKKNIPEYYSDPNSLGEELIRIISLHDKVKNPSEVKMSSTFEEIGLDSLDFIDILVQIEFELGFDFGPSDWEQFITISDIATFLAKDYFAQKH